MIARIALVLRAILAELRRPDDQAGDWYAWASVQMAHALIGVGLAGALVFAGVATYPAAVAAAILYGFGKELPDLWAAPGWRTARDSLRDWLFVAGGSVAAAALADADALIFTASASAVATGLAIGAYQRAATALFPQEDPPIRP